ncbi:TonB-dependent receptor [Phenylobacterium sp. LjRoot225]|uniref:TonB-dependent receptor n=1 Tax=Phenylobacterium sp. LjRoot225 TaxID=3342285 RepID=UPI003ED1406E
MKSDLLFISAGVMALSCLSAAPASAAPSGQAEAAPTLGEVVVTARRVEERLQDVPISMTVYSQQALNDRNVVTPSDLATYTPSLSVNQRYGPEKSSFAIRGFNQDQSTAPTVGVYFADVVGPRAQGGTTSGSTVGAGAFMDLQNVQVLKGPQGTLFGRNTTGGAVLLVPNRPSDRFEGYVEGSLGNYDLRRLQGVLNVPIADNLRARVAVDRNKREGYMRNHSGIGPDDYNDTNYFAARLSVVADLTPDLETYTIGSYSNSFSNGYAARNVLCDTRFLPGSPNFNPALAADPRNINKLRVGIPGCNQINRQAARGDSLLDVEVANPDPYLKLKQWQLINTTTWRASDNLTVKNIVSYAEFRERASFSLYSDNFFATSPPLAASSPFVGTPFSYILLNPAGSEDNASQSTFTEELQFQGTAIDGRLTWQAGAYLELSRPIGWSAGYTAQYLNCADLQAFQCVSPYGNGNFSASATKLRFDNKGVYAQATYKLTEQLSLTGGIRYTMDKIEAAGEGTRINFSTTGAITSQTCNDGLRFNVPDGPDPGTAPDALAVASRTQCHFEITNKSEKPTWLLGLDYKPTDDLLLYGKYARGYRQGGVNMTNVGIETWQPEKVDAYEVGAKASFDNVVRGYFNVAVFYNDFRNQQIFAGLTADPTSGLAGGAAIINAGKSRIRGVEADAAVTLFEGFRLDLGYTYLDTKVLKITAPVASYPFIAITPTVAEGTPLTLSPKHRVTLTATYTLPVDESLGRMSIGATYTHTASQIANGSVPASVGVLPATDLLNLNANWNGVFGSPVDLALFVTNVTDEIYAVNTGGGFNSAGFDNILIGQPRIWGVRMRYSFGS